MALLDCGIMIEYDGEQFVISRIDDTFVQEELQALKRNKCTLYYVSKGIVDLFLLHIEDSLETSDIPFCFQESKSDSLLASLERDQQYKIEIRYLDQNGQLLGVRRGLCSNAMTQCIQSGFKAQVNYEFDEEIYEASLAKIQMKYEPFELEEIAVASCKI